jgi:hypothetical protein
MTLSESEFAALRQTISSRGTTRMVLLPVTLAGWAGAALLGDIGGVPHATLFALIVLAAGFEAIHALHAGVERIGRYLQVFYEGSPGSPKWETTAMAVGPALPGGGVDPLFTVVFGLAALVNLIPAFMPWPAPLEGGFIATVHVVFLVRLVRARVAAARQRAVELESYRAIKSRQPAEIS